MMFLKKYYLHVVAVDAFHSKTSSSTNFPLELFIFLNSRLFL